MVIHSNDKDDRLKLKRPLQLLLLALLLSVGRGFVTTTSRSWYHQDRPQRIPRNLFTFKAAPSVLCLLLDPTLDETRTEDLFAWVACAMQGDEQYEDLVGMAIPAIFGIYENEDEEEEDDKIQYEYLLEMKQQARETIFHQRQNPDNNISCIFVGIPYCRQERESHSLGPLGAGQWSGQYPETFAHSLLKLMNDFPTADDWVAQLPRTCRQTIRKCHRILQKEGWTFHLQVIRNNEPAPHSTYGHFRCVLEHQIRSQLQLQASTLLADQQQPEQHAKEKENEEASYINLFFNAVLEAIERYTMSLEMTGSILEYRDASHHIQAFCHIVTKGKVLRGQWFYASDRASRKMVWFHAIWYMVDRSCRLNHKHMYMYHTTNDSNDNHPLAVEVIDLGPNGVDGQYQPHERLKQKYGFEPHKDWPAVANYRGFFWVLGED